MGDPGRLAAAAGDEIVYTAFPSRKQACAPKTILEAFSPPRPRGCDGIFCYCLVEL